MQENKRFFIRKTKSIEVDRLIDAIQLLIDIGKVRSFADAAKQAGYRSQDFTDLKSGKKDLQRIFLDDLCNIHPINKDYILTGKGEVLTIHISAPSEPNPKPQQFDFNRWMDNEEKKTAYMQDLVTANSQLVATNSKLVEMLNKASESDGVGGKVFQKQIDELSRRIDRFLESWNQKRAKDAI